METKPWVLDMHRRDYGLWVRAILLPRILPAVLLVLAAVASVRPAQAAVSAETLYQLLVAEMAQQTGNTVLAARAYERLAEGSTDPRAAQKAVVLLVAIGDRSGALGMARRWLALEPSNGEAQATLDYLRLLLDRRSDLLTSLTARRDLAAQAGPEALNDFYGELDGLVRQTDQARRSLEIFDSVAQPHAALPSVRYTRALLLERAGDVAAMERILRELIAERPQDAQARNALGYSLADRNVQLDEAQELIESANRLAPGQAHIEDSMGWVAYRQGRIRDALTWLSKAHQKAADPEIAAHFGEVLWSVGQRDRAALVWHMALITHPRHPALLATLARLGIPPEAFAGMDHGRSDRP